MGCICSRSSAVEDSRESPEVRPSSNESSELGLPRFDSSRRENELRLKDKLGSADISFMFIEKNVNDSMWLHDDDQIERTKKRAEKPEFSIVNHPSFGRVPKAMVGEQVAAGWPNWLSAVAGEAIKGWVPLCEENFEKIDKIGQGTYSNVFKARDTMNNKIVALKKVRFDCLDTDSVKFMAREIIILRRLDHPNVIKLEGLITSRTSSRLYLVFEYMEHDLTGLASRPGLKFAESQVKCYTQQLLNGLDHCHSHGVLHRDIKGSNLLIGNNGILKIADFGLASYFNSQSDCPLTTRVVTLWYRPPELLLGACHYDVAVDLWSTGCVLGELYAGKPILPGKTEVEQLHKIFKLCGSPSEDYWRDSKLPHSTVFKPLHPYKRCVSETFRHIPAAAVGLLETLLAVDPADRGTAARALSSEFFTTKPLACDPSSLPKYPPSKEIDVDVVEDETRRREACGGWRRDSKGPREPQRIPAPNVSTELAILMQQRRGHASSTSHGRNSHSGPLVPRNGWAKARKEHDDTVLGRSNQSLSGSVATRTFFPDECHEKPRPLQAHTSNQVARSHRSFNGPDSTRNQDGKHHLQIRCVYESKGSKIYASGPLLGPSSNVDQMCKEHDRKIQEFSRRACLDKTRLERGHLEGKRVMVDI